MMYNSILHACSVIFLPILAIESQEFDQHPMQTWQNNLTSSIIADVGKLTSLWFTAHLRSHIQMASEITGRFKMTFFLCQIYEFNIN